MSRLSRIISLGLLSTLTPACHPDLTAPNPGATSVIARSAASANGGLEGTPGKRARRLNPHVSIQPYGLVPPSCFPACPDIAHETARGHDILTRRRGTAIHRVVLKENVRPGHVYVYVLTPFNHPEECHFVEDRFLGVPYPCRANGPLDRLDGLDPATGFYVGTYGGRVAETERVRFRIDVAHDTPTEVIVGPGVTNAAGMMFYAGVMDKGPALPEGHHLRWAQLNTLKGGCQGPPAFGPLPCAWVHVSAHAPR